MRTFLGSLCRWKLSVAVVWLSIVLFPGCSSRPAPSRLLEFSGDSVAIPIRFLNNRPVVDVKVNGQGPFSLLLDTGSTGISLEKGVVKQLKLPDSGTVTRTNAASEQFEARLFGVDLIEIGESSLAKVAVRESDFFEKHGMIGIHGIWGMGHFGKRLVTVDFVDNVLHIRLQAAELADDNPWLPMGSNEAGPEVSIQIGERAYDFLIDTGSPGSLAVSACVAAELPRSEKRFADVGAAAGGFLAWSIETRLSVDIPLGFHIVERPYVSWYHDRPGRNLIGMEILRHFAVEFDFMESRVRFLRDVASPLSISDKRRLGIFITKSSKDNSYVASHISSYRATMDDVKIGDRILAINDHPMSSISSSLLTELIETRDILKFSVQRSGETLLLEVLVHQDSFGPGP